MTEESAARLLDAVAASIEDAILNRSSQPRRLVRPIVFKRQLTTKRSALRRKCIAQEDQAASGRHDPVKSREADEQSLLEVAIVSPTELVFKDSLDDFARPPPSTSRSHRQKQEDVLTSDSDTSTDSQELSPTATLKRNQRIKRLYSTATRRFVIVAKNLLDRSPQKQAEFLEDQIIEAFSGYDFRLKSFKVDLVRDEAAIKQHCRDKNFSSGKLLAIFRRSGCLLLTTAVGRRKKNNPKTRTRVELNVIILLNFEMVKNEFMPEVAVELIDKIVENLINPPPKSNRKHNASEFSVDNLLNEISWSILASAFKQTPESIISGEKSESEGSSASARATLVNLDKLLALLQAHCGDADARSAAACSILTTLAITCGRDKLPAAINTILESKRNVSMIVRQLWLCTQTTAVPDDCRAAIDRLALLSYMLQPESRGIEDMISEVFAAGFSDSAELILADKSDERFPVGLKLQVLNIIAAMCLNAFGKDLVDRKVSLKTSLSELANKSGDRSSELARIASGTLSILEKDEAKQPIESQTQSAETNEPVQYDFDVMMSYCWAQKTLVRKIAEDLKKNGFGVWIDTEYMKGDADVAMTEAVNSSRIVLICISADYAASYNCRFEAKYAFQQKKQVIPLKVSPWKATGWLGLLLGSKLFYDFSAAEAHDREYRDRLSELVAVLKSEIRTAGGADADADANANADSTGPDTHGSGYSKNVEGETRVSLRSRTQAQGRTWQLPRIFGGPLGEAETAVRVKSSKQSIFAVLPTRPDGEHVADRKVRSGQGQVSRKVGATSDSDSDSNSRPETGLWSAKALQRQQAAAAQPRAVSPPGIGKEEKTGLTNTGKFGRSDTFFQKIRLDESSLEAFRSDGEHVADRKARSGQGQVSRKVGVASDLESDSNSRPETGLWSAKALQRQQAIAALPRAVSPPAIGKEEKTGLTNIGKFGRSDTFFQTVRLDESSLQTFREAATKTRRQVQPDNVPSANQIESNFNDAVPLRMRECMSVHVGRAGMRIGEACWDLMRVEHNLSIDGRDEDAARLAIQTSSSGVSIERRDVFFTETSKGRSLARASFVDYPAEAVEEVRSGRLGSLFSQQQFVSQSSLSLPSDSTDLQKLSKVVEVTMERVRQLAEECNSMLGLLMYYAVSDNFLRNELAVEVGQSLALEFANKQTWNVAVYPSLDGSNGSSTIECCNAALLLRSLNEASKCEVCFDNSALFDVYRAHTRARTGLGSEPTYANANQLIAHVVSNMTASMRFSSQPILGLDSLATNLVVQPRLHYLVPAYAPILPVGEGESEQTSLANMTRSCLKWENQLFKTSDADKVITGALLYRGDVSVGSVAETVSDLMKAKTIRAVNWQPFKPLFGITSREPQFLAEDIGTSKRSVCSLSTHSGFGSYLGRLASRCETAMNEEAVKSYYANSWITSEQIDEARNIIAAIGQEYESIAADAETD